MYEELLDGQGVVRVVDGVVGAQGAQWGYCATAEVVATLLRVVWTGWVVWGWDRHSFINIMIQLDMYKYIKV